MEEAKTKTNKKPLKNQPAHMEPGSCPGQAYFEKRDKQDHDMFQAIVIEALGDVPKYMRMAGYNRIWLYLLTFLVFMDTAMLLALLVTISRLPQ